MKPLTDKQKKAAWIVAGILLVLHFAPAVIHSVIAATHPAPAPRRVIAAVPVPPTMVVPVPAGLPPAIQSLYLGNFEGAQWMGQNQKECRIHLEIRQSTVQPDHVSAYERRTCIDTPNLANPRIAPKGLQQLLQDSNPVENVLEGTASDGSLAFQVKDVIGSSPDYLACPFTSYRVSSFGANSVVAQWKGENCGGQMVLSRQRGL